MNLLMPWLVVMALAATVVLQQLLHNQQTMRWMRLLSERLSVPTHIMEGVEPPPEPAHAEKVDNRKRISIPVPSGPWRPNGPMIPRMK